MMWSLSSESTAGALGCGLLTLANHVTIMGKVAHNVLGDPPVMTSQDLLLALPTP